jgi:hypothetical protein
MCWLHLNHCNVARFRVSEDTLTLAETLLFNRDRWRHPSENHQLIGLMEDAPTDAYDTNCLSEGGVCSLTLRDGANVCLVLCVCGRWLTSVPTCSHHNRHPHTQSHVLASQGLIDGAAPSASIGR